MLHFNTLTMRDLPREAVEGRLIKPTMSSLDDRPT